MENDNYISAIELFEIRRGLDLRIESLKESIDLCKKVGSDDTFWQESLAAAKKIEKQLLCSYRVTIK
jgi:hypothetical protein